MKKLNTILILISAFACTTETVRFNDLATIRINKNTIVANGFDTATFILEFNNNNSNIDLVKANAEIVNGKFADSESKELTIKPIKDPDGIIRANVDVVSTTVADTLKVIFNINEFKTISKLATTKSIPASINLKASAFSVANSFDSEIKITGTVLNSDGKKVSNGYKVVVNDSYQNGNAVNGLLRETSLTTNNGQISFIYSPGSVNPEQFINMSVIVLNEEGLLTEITNQIEIYVTDKND